jgi:hypothetical protein
MDLRPYPIYLVSFPLHEDVFTSPAIVGLEVAEELHAKGYVVMRDPWTHEAAAEWDSRQQSALLFGRRAGIWRSR